MSEIMETIQLKLKGSSASILTFSVRLFSALVLGLTFALIGETIFAFNTFSFVLIVIVVGACYMRKTRKWTLLSVLMLDLFLVLVAMLLRMYILIAPGA